MITKKPRILIIQDGRNLAFCHLRFRDALSAYVNRQNREGHMITRTEVCQNLAAHLNLSQDAIDNYKKGYNGPASIDVVKDMATYLGLEWTELMKEVNPMSEKKMMEMEKKLEERNGKESGTVTKNAYQLTEFEKRTAWNAVREVYKALRVFITFFEDDHTVILDLNDPMSNVIIRSYNYCWTILHKNMLDIPDGTYNQLHELIGELHYWIYEPEMEELEEGYYMSVDPDVYIKLKYFRQLEFLGLYDEMEVERKEWEERVTSWLIKDFYDAVREILQNYIPREPAAGEGCPQENPKAEEC